MELVVAVVDDVIAGLRYFVPGAGEVAERLDWQDLGLEEAEQYVAQLDPDPFADRHLPQEHGDLGGQGLQVHL